MVDREKRERKEREKREKEGGSDGGGRRRRRRRRRRRGKRERVGGGGGGRRGGKGNQNKRESKKIDRRRGTFIDANYRATVWARKPGTGNKADEFDLKREKIDEDEEEEGADEQLLLISILDSLTWRIRLHFPTTPVTVATDSGCYDNLATTWPHGAIQL